MNLEQIANALKMQPDPVLTQKVQQQNPLEAAISAAILQSRQQTRAAAAPQQVAPIAQQPPVTQGLFPVIAQAAQQLMQQRATAPQAGLGAVEPPIHMASGGVVAMQGGGDPRDYVSSPEEQPEYAVRDGRSLREILRGLGLSAVPERAGAPRIPYETVSPSGLAGALKTIIAGGGDPEFYSRAFANAPTAKTSRLDAASPVESTGTPRPTPLRPPMAGRAPTAGIPGAVAMTTPEMGPPRPQGGLADVAPPGFEEPIERYHASARPSEAPAEASLERQRALEQKYGVRPAGQALMEQLQRELAQGEAEGKTIDRRAQERAFAAGIGSRNIQEMLGTMARTGAEYKESAETHLKNAQMFRQLAISKLQDAENERQRKNITQEVRNELDAKKAMEAHNLEIAKAKTARASKESELRSQEAREKLQRETQVETTRMQGERMLESARIQARASLQAANAGANIREGTALATARERATNNAFEVLAKNSDFSEKLGKDPASAIQIVLRTAATMNPGLFPEFQKQGGSAPAASVLKPGQLWGKVE